MKDRLENALTNRTRDAFVQYCSESGITQLRMAEKLMMDTRSYADLEHGIHCCSALTLALILTNCCADPAAFLEELRTAFEQAEREC